MPTKPLKPAASRTAPQVRAKRYRPHYDGQIWLLEDLRWTPGHPRRGCRMRYPISVWGGLALAKSICRALNQCDQGKRDQMTQREVIPGPKRLGHWVRVKGGNQRQVAHIVAERPAITRGTLFVEPALAGFRWWNKSELERVCPPRGSK